jgi:hypothetical protein
VGGMNQTWLGRYGHKITWIEVILPFFSEIEEYEYWTL